MKHLSTVLVLLLVSLVFFSLTQAEHERKEPSAIPAQTMGPTNVADSSNADPLSSPKEVPCGTGYETGYTCDCVLSIYFDAYVTGLGTICTYLAGSGYRGWSVNIGTNALICKSSVSGLIEIWRLYHYVPYGTQCGSASKYQTFYEGVEEIQYAAMLVSTGADCYGRQYSDIITLHPLDPPDTTEEDTPEPQELGPQDNCASSLGY